MKYWSGIDMNGTGWGLGLSVEARWGEKVFLVLFLVRYLYDTQPLHSYREIISYILPKNHQTIFSLQLKILRSKEEGRYGLQSWWSK